nr:protein kinase superfamily protein [Tanacetum cinerariifolium]
MSMKGNEKNNETLVALTPILSVEDKRYEGASFTQRMIPSIPIGGSISPEGFFLPILLLVVIIVTVVIVEVILVVVVVAIVGVVTVVTIIGVIIGVVVVIVVFAIIKLSFVIIVDLTGDEDPTDEDKDTEVGDSEVSVSLGEISLGGRKFQESSIGDSDNTGDGDTTVGEKTSVAKRYLVKSSEELGELFPDEQQGGYGQLGGQDLDLWCLTTFSNWNNLLNPFVLVWWILKTIVDEFIVRFGVDVSLDFGFPLNDELGVILPKKSNKCVGEMMTSLSNKYEILKKTLEELGLDLSILLPEQDPSLLKKNRKAMELKPETYNAGLHCNRKLPEGVDFVKNLVIEVLDHGLFFIDAFEKPTFQRVNDIHNVETETLLGYNVMASNVKTAVN